MPELIERFTQDLAEVHWKDLRVHLQRDALITLSADLDLIAVATAVARDETARVEAWIAAGQLEKPSAEQIRAWEQELEKPFRMLIVQPYILVQAVTHA